MKEQITYDFENKRKVRHTTITCSDLEFNIWKSGELSYDRLTGELVAKEMLKNNKEHGYIRFLTYDKFFLYGDEIKIESGEKSIEITLLTNN